MTEFLRFKVLLKALFVRSENEQDGNDHSEEWHYVVVEEEDSVINANDICVERQVHQSCEDENGKTLNDEDSKKLHC